MGAHQSNIRGECQMVAHQYFDNQSEPAAPPPNPPPEGEGNRNSTPPKRLRGGLVAAIAALTVASGAGSGAIAAGLIDHSTASASAGTALPTTQTSTGSTSPSTAASIYKQDLPGVVTLAVNLSRGQAIGSGIVLDTKGDILTHAHVVAGGQHIPVAVTDRTTGPRTVGG